MAERIEGRSIQLKRRAVARFIKTLWPTEFKEYTSGDLSALNERLKSGAGAVGLVPHFSKGDFLTILGGLVTNSVELVKRPVLIPIAAHQRPKYLDWICTFSHIGLATIVTIETRSKEKQLKASGKPVPWKELDPKTAMDVYLNKAIETLNEGGIVILAPQGGRKSVLTHFRGGPLARLEQRNHELGLNGMAYFPIGLEIEGAQDYSKLKDLNIRRKHCITLGRVTEGRQITDDPDNWAYQRMLELAPPAYRPQKLES